MVDVIIYGLIDPRNGQLRYVGQSIDGLRRPQAHWKHKRCREKRDHTHNWVRNVLADDLVPEIEILEEWDGEGDWIKWLDENEIFYITYFRMVGANLTNLTSGGGGTKGMKFPNRKPMTEEQKRKLSQALTGRKLSVEQRAAISKGQRENRVYPKHYDWGWKISEALRGKKQPRDVVEKRAKSHMGMKYKTHSGLRAKKP